MVFIIVKYIYNVYNLIFDKLLYTIIPIFHTKDDNFDIIYNNYFFFKLSFTLKSMHLLLYIIFSHDLLLQCFSRALYDFLNTFHLLSYIPFNTLIHFYLLYIVAIYSYIN